MDVYKNTTWHLVSSDTLHAFFIRKLVMLLVLDLLKIAANCSSKTVIRLSQIYGLVSVILTVKKEITYKTKILKLLHYAVVQELFYHSQSQ